MTHNITMDNTLTLGPLVSSTVTSTQIPSSSGLLSTNNISGPLSLSSSGSIVINSNQNPNSYITLQAPQMNNGVFSVKGDSEFNGDVKIKGVSLCDSLAAIEQRLGILHYNQNLEEKWEELKDLGQKYRELEEDILEKEKIWAILSK